jgi:hypothetical protein
MDGKVMTTELALDLALEALENAKEVFDEAVFGLKKEGN